jgi:ribosomal protein L34E
MISRTRRARPIRLPRAAGADGNQDCPDSRGLAQGVVRARQRQVRRFPEMAIRLSKAFGGSTEVWLRMQMNYDLWHAEQNADRIKIERYLPA